MNSTLLRKTADRMIAAKVVAFGKTNAGSALVLTEIEKKPPTDLEEEISGKEGRILTRVHVYKERDRKLVGRVKAHHRKLNSGKLQCEACDLVPGDVYGLAGERSIEAHHRVPIEQLQPDSITTVKEMAIVCATCHRVVHSERPCLTIDQVRGLLGKPSLTP